MILVLSLGGNLFARGRPEEATAEESAYLSLVIEPDGDRVHLPGFNEFADVDIQAVWMPPPDLVIRMMSVLSVYPDPAFVDDTACVEVNRSVLELLWN